MSKKNNNELRKRNDARIEHDKQKEFLIKNGLDESIAEELTKTKKRKNRKEENSGD